MDNIETTHKTSNDDFVTIPDLWHICVAHWNWFAASLIICLGIACYYLTISPKIYTRSVSVLVKQETQGKTTNNKNNGDNDFNDIGLVTQNTNVANVERQFTSLQVLVEVAKRTMHPRNDREALHMAESIKSKLKTNIENDKSTIISIEYSAPSTDEADRVLSSIVTVYNEQWMEDNNMIAINSSHFIEDRLQLLRKDLGNIDDSISKFKKQHNITDLEHVSDIYLQQQSQSDADIMRLSSQRSMAQFIYNILKDKAKKHQLLPTNTGLNNVLQEQINQYNSMLLQLKNSLTATSSQNPLIIKQEAELDELRHNILSTINNQIKVLSIQIGAMQGYNEEVISKISSNPNQAKHLASVEREQKVKESLYLYLLQKKEENQISLTYSSKNTQMIDMPHGSEMPTSPKKTLILFSAILFAIIAPTIILFVRESFDNSVRCKGDIEHRTSLSLIGDIPLYQKKNKRNIIDMLIGKRKPKKNMLVVEPDKQDGVNEAFRYVRSNLEFMTTNRNTNNVYIITSNYAGSGKTFITTNLAVSLAIVGKRVLLIDGDLRHASASRMFHTKNKGLADYLAEQETNFENLLYHSEKYDTLDIMPVGTIPPNPTELLSNKRMQTLIDDMRSHYDFILIDCPPSEALADTGIIEQYADRTLFVMRAGMFDRRNISDLDTDVENGKFKHMSIILNASQLGGRYGYYHGSYNAYYYGYHYGSYYKHTNS